MSNPDFAPVRFCKQQISDLIEQMKAPVTADPKVEREELVAEVVYWHAQLKAVEAA